MNSLHKRGRAVISEHYGIQSTVVVSKRLQFLTGPRNAHLLLVDWYDDEVFRKQINIFGPLLHSLVALLCSTANVSTKRGKCVQRKRAKHMSNIVKENDVGGKEFTTTLRSC
jgi:hypothetical protein